MSIHIETIALSKLIPSDANVRRTGRTERIEELAASIEAHGLLQNLTVRPAAKDRFEVIAGGRRLAALKLLVKRKAWAKDAAIPCQIIADENATEISLAENALQCPMHPADQFEAFATLHGQQMSVEDIAARFGVSPKIVLQRLKLGAVSPALMEEYRKGEMKLDQLSAFAITDDHTVQERVWQELGYNRSRKAILQALNEGRVSTDDRRAIYVGEEAYRAAGGNISRDLFDEDGGGFFDDAALLNRLVTEKLTIEAKTVSAEGWKWVAVEASFDHSLAAGMRRIYPASRELTEDEKAKIEILTARYHALCDEGEGESSDKIDAELADIDRQIDALRGDEFHRDEDKVIAGAFISLAHDGTPRIERGFVRPEDDTQRKVASESGKATKAKDDIPAKLVAELTAYRSAALSNELAQRPDIALVAITHALVAQLFYGRSEEVSCLKLSTSRARLANHVGDIGEGRAMTEIEARHTAWERQLPEEPTQLWSFISSLDEAERMALLAHCVSLTVDAVRTPMLAVGGTMQTAESMATVLRLDMTGYWQPSAAGYFGRVSKPRILEAVREAISPEKAQTLADMKKAAMAERAETLLVATGWLPPVLRTAAE